MYDKLWVNENSSASPSAVSPSQTIIRSYQSGPKLTSTNNNGLSSSSDSCSSSSESNSSMGDLKTPIGLSS